LACRLAACHRQSQETNDQAQSDPPGSQTREEKPVVHGPSAATCSNALICKQRFQSVAEYVLERCTIQIIEILQGGIK
jgi:hypothetical protein